jgi:hypothetical protein
MIAAGDDFNAARKELLGEARRDAEAGRRIFAVCDTKIDLTLRKDVCEAVMNDFAAG